MHPISLERDLLILGFAQFLTELLLCLPEHPILVQHCWALEIAMSYLEYEKQLF